MMALVYSSRCFDECSDKDLRYWRKYTEIPHEERVRVDYYYRAYKKSHQKNIKQVVDDDDDDDVALVSVNPIISTPIESAPGLLVLIVRGEVVLLQVASVSSSFFDYENNVKGVVVQLMHFDLPPGGHGNKEHYEEIIKKYLTEFIVNDEGRVLRVASVEVMFDQDFTLAPLEQ